MDPIVLIPITVIFLVAMIVGRNELVRRKLTCPRRGTTAEVDVLRRSLKPTRLVCIKRCSLLANPKKIDCGQECLNLGAYGHGSAPWGSTAASLSSSGSSDR